jgi:hypothetical protein
MNLMVNLIFISDHFEQGRVENTIRLIAWGQHDGRKQRIP